MKNENDKTIKTEHLIIGSGISGLMLAINLARQDKVLIITKGSLYANNTFYAQGGIASVQNNEDSFEKHVQDTLIAGAGLCHLDVVENIIKGGPNAINALIEMGVKFTEETKNGKKAYHLTTEGGHSERRVFHAEDLTGQAIIHALVAAVRSHPNIRIMEDHFAIDLITTDRYLPNFHSNDCLGAYVFDISQQEIYQIRSLKTYLCTGGHGRIYLYTSNPENATGDGLAMAWRAGCKLANLEFMQFHPTCLFHPEAKNFLISEALRGEGGKLINKKGEDFISAVHKNASLAPRDIVARAIDFELKKSGEQHVLLDIRHLGENKIKKSFPNIYLYCQNLGLDITKNPIPVVPAAHYSCGGIVVDHWGRSNVRGLYALGEVACTGLHGANRLASNSLLEACVLAEKAAQKSLEETMPSSYDSEKIPPWEHAQKIPASDRVLLSQTWDEIRRLMWNYVGIIRSEYHLRRAVLRIESIKYELDDYYWRYKLDESLLEVRNLALVASLTIRCAMRRKESRGIHYNQDFPDLLDVARDTIISN